MSFYRCDLPSENVLSLPTMSNSVSGSLVNFNTSLALPLVSLKTEIKATGGGGTPQSAIPVVGAREVNVTRCKKNYFDLSYLTATDISISNGVASGTANAFNNAFGTTGQGLKGKFKFKANTQYTWSLKAYTDGNSSTEGNGLRIAFVYTDGTASHVNLPNNTSSWTSFERTSTSGKTIDYAIIYFANTGANIWHLKEIQLEEGSTATAYEEYSGDTFTLPLGQTVYGGYVDWEMGKLVVTWGTIDLNDNTLNWDYRSTQKIFRSIALSNIKIPTSAIYTFNGLCEIFTVETGSNVYNNAETYDNCIACSSDGRLWVSAQAYNNDLTAFKNAINGKLLAYELATPIEISLPTTMPQTIQGVQNWFADSGDVELSYWQTIKDKLGV